MSYLMSYWGLRWVLCAWHYNLITVKGWLFGIHRTITQYCTISTARIHEIRREIRILITNSQRQVKMNAWRQRKSSCKCFNCIHHELITVLMLHYDLDNSWFKILHVTLSSLLSQATERPLWFIKSRVFSHCCKQVKH